MTAFSSKNALNCLFEDPIIVVAGGGAGAGAGDVDALYEEERLLVANAVKKRREEFAAGRLCAREALRLLGLEDFPILTGEGREPVWPDGVSGSISHSRRYYSAAVFRSDKKGLIGLDIEESHRLRKDLWSMTFVEEEIEWLRGRNLADKEVAKWATLIFSAKEAFYKFQYPLTRSWLGLKDACVEVSNTGKFSIKVLKEVNPYLKVGDCYRGRYVFFEHYVASGLYLLKGLEEAKAE